MLSTPGLSPEDYHINLSLFDYFSQWCVQKMNIVRIDPGTSFLKLPILWTSPPCLPNSPSLACMSASSAGSCVLHFDLWMWILSNINILFWIISKWVFYSSTDKKKVFSAQYSAFPIIARPPLLLSSLRWRLEIYLPFVGYSKTIGVVYCTVYSLCCCY